MCRECLIGADANDFFKCNEADVCVCFFSLFLNATSILVLLLRLSLVLSCMEKLMQRSNKMSLNQWRNYGRQWRQPPPGASPVGAPGNQVFFFYQYTDHQSNPNAENIVV